MFKKYWWIVTLAVILKLILALSTFHSDTRHLELAGQIVSQGNILNLYDYPETSGELFNYPPLIYLLHGIFAFLFLPPKIPYLIFDLGAAWALTKLFEGEKKKLWVFCLWLFNPVNLYATYMIGQFDIIPTFFVILSLLWAQQKKLNWAALSIGFGTAFKIFPLPLLLPLAFLEKTFWGKFKLISLGILPYVASVLPYIGSSGYRSTALVASQTDKSLFANIAVSGGEKILLYPAFLIFIVIIFYYFRGKIENLWQRYFILLLLFFIFTHTHPQWFLWLTPFLIIEMVSNNFKHVWVNITMFVSFIFLVFSFESSLSLGLFAPIWPNLSSSMTIWQILGITIDNIYYRSLWQTVFVGAALYLIYYYFPRKSND